MKLLRFMKTNAFLLILTLFLFISCSENETNLLQKTLPDSEIQMAIMTDGLSADVNSIVEQDEIDGRYASKGESNSSTCATRTVTTTDTGKLVVLDFGDGCTGDNGKEYAGKINIAYTRAITGYSKKVMFDGFTINGNLFAGTKSIVWLKENANKNPESTITKDVTITLKGGEILVRKGVKIREKIAGKDTRRRGDDVYLISGNWQSINRNGVVRKATIKTKLRREYVCRFVVSGVIEISRDGVKATVDFGDGSCDDKAEVTDANGETKEISLGR